MNLERHKENTIAYTSTSENKLKWGKEVGQKGKLTCDRLLMHKFTKLVQ